MDHGSMGGSSADCKMSMLWNWYTIDACFLAESWQIKNAGMFAASCIGVGVLTVFLEIFRRLGKEYDALIQRQFQARAAELQSRIPKETSSCCDSESTPTAAVVAASQTLVFRASPLQQLIRSVIHAATFGLAYIVMLLAMYYNGYLIISIIIGAGLGKFLCDWLVVRVTLEAPTALPTTPTARTTPKAPGIEEPSVCCG
ncbi:high affinity copper transporter [Colletotrichum karsti]|uniref:Copper transport protein n=1 Tax=Colletotrichum karsti TaxID=1095194 RepID=A0A9P6IFD5_9PEZI|nr:high affinity copper transporter [Colletotrichum karsti]KAF9882473.1 high affinity copper transporter [Colletotrichum karsti]